MKKISLILAFAFLWAFANAQVGIRTQDPKAVVDIRASNVNNPSNQDGILIPRIDQFPSPSPTAAQTGMLVYLTTTDSAGFFYWDTRWIRLDAGPSPTTFTTSPSIQCFNNNTIDSVSALGASVPVRWTGEDVKDASVFTHSNAVNPERIYLNVKGIYEISYSIPLVSDEEGDTTLGFKSLIMKNGTVLERGAAYNSTYYILVY
jgi:hypothetical protein